jgi:hypothetical protein
MKPQYPAPPTPPGKADEPVKQSRFLDEKISDDSGFETIADTALAPAGLNNPFWK